MKSTEYSEKTLDHFRNPRNVGTLEGENVAMGRVGNPVCGDLMEIYINVNKDTDTIEDIKFKTFGCGSAVATSSMITEMAKGKSLDEALRITRQDVADELDGLPPIKMHCSNLAADALHDAIKNYREGKNAQEIESEEFINYRVCNLNEISGGNDFVGRGVYVKDINFNELKDKRILVLENGDNSIEVALKLEAISGRVILLSMGKQVKASDELKTKLKQSHVKILKQSKLKEISGSNSVEKVLIHDLDEDETYELFVDAVVYS
ncbi:MAG: iron-sulfur cluster assembly scaffold protein [Spirochaetota bacterium]|nr:iron-sulfur cluster assembly scaffold protein [Spirochaetota bacterium]